MNATGIGTPHRSPVPSAHLGVERAPSATSARADDPRSGAAPSGQAHSGRVRAALGGQAHGGWVRGVVGVLAVGLVGLTAGCAGLGSAHDEVSTSYDSGSAGKRHSVLPSWVPDDATEIRMLRRTDGQEQILTLRASLDELPSTCTAVDAQNPLVPHPDDPSTDASDYRTVSTLRADWWPVEVEQKASVMCGRWWITDQDGELYAFTPELRTVPVG